MQLIRYTCDKCGKQITDTVFTLTCYAKDINLTPADGCTYATAMHNDRQNAAIQREERHLCRGCKDTITDGVFIV